MVYKVIDESITEEEREKVSKLLLESNGMKDAKLDDILRENVEKDFDCEFFNRKVVLKNPNPIISRVLHKERAKAKLEEDVSS